ncbi:MAG TPA: metallophosphoesterase [Anaerolineae bacterium]|nr:metallophosphoesterase [Anaerolineae bacterium]
MKILAVSDQVVDSLYTVSVRERFSDIDLILGCGDLPYYYLEFLTTVLNRDVYFVHGNHDQSIEISAEGERRITAEGCNWLGGRTVNYKGLLLAGLDGSIRYNYGSPYQFSQAEMQRKTLALALRLAANRLRYGRWLDILVTHSPPFGVGDGPDAAHIGFRAFNTLMRWFKPRYLLHGHQHYYRGLQPGTRFAATQVLNVFPYRVIEWGPEDVD